MPNNGAVDIMPGAVAQTIPAGYHNGAGTVAGDGNLVAGNIKAGVSIFGVAGTLSSGGVLKTGQTTAYGTGTDGDLRNGASHTFTDNGDGTITDNTTGLMWEKKSRDGSIHDYGNTYTWSGASYGGTYIMDGTITGTFLAMLNSGGGFVGHTDWRIPNSFELYTLENFENTPSVDAVFNTNCAPGCTVTTCSCTSLNPYWSSSTRTEAYGSAFFVSFYIPQVANDVKTSFWNVRAVRGGS
jgi:hypothetical protein